ncbi:MAG: hypothetical protein H7123_04480, partial [Thermoleophilia bacterium]|nr:hypothetical protein [Thermoleophilia bacterium]
MRIPPAAVAMPLTTAVSTGLESVKAQPKPAPAPGPAPTELTSIPTIQGAVDASSLVGTTVMTSGVVTAVANVKGAFDSQPKQVVFVQDLAGDGDAHTSDAMAIRTESPFTGKIGSSFTFTGVVKEYDNMTTLWHATAEAVKGAKAVTRADLPVTALSLPADVGDSALWMEAHEGMLGSLTGALVMTPTTSYGTFTAVEEVSHGVRKDYDGANQGQHVDVTSDGGVRSNVNTGDRLSSIVGPIDQTRGTYRVVQQNDDAKRVAGPKAPNMWGDIDGNGKITDTDIAAIKGRIDALADGPLDAAD